ncbi:hypothetical protein L198_00693 [Cryptococcus wingfieldii CBS 7118]|uniref:Uncharacterized protein n=1 Tax=Cryptococcus wingfieldii CBS 7118 TaxID=1295528 RepID=A0A1E3K6Z2_9TREE|nr:hypothetical protein L198_00693 [Cryptococcus wingfieldii CBS 7118]ODO08954.1 hypothetical protein L198_00693 [Cryptococcus wingfieldii CBS 7118]
MLKEEQEKRARAAASAAKKAAKASASGSSHRPSSSNPTKRTAEVSSAAGSSKKARVNSNPPKGLKKGVKSRDIPVANRLVSASATGNGEHPVDSSSHGPSSSTNAVLTCPCSDASRTSQARASAATINLVQLEQAFEIYQSKLSKLCKEQRQAGTLTEADENQKFNCVNELIALNDLRDAEDPTILYQKWQDHPEDFWVTSRGGSVWGCRGR